MKTLFFTSAVVLIAAPAFADVKVGVASGYYDDNAVQLSDGPVAQLELEAGLNDWLTIHGSTSTGFSSSKGDEYAYGFTFAGNISDKTVVRASVSRYALVGYADMTELIFSVQRDNCDVSVTQFAFDGTEDGQRAQIGCSVEQGPWSLRAQVTADQGQGYEDSLTSGLQLSRELSDRIAITGNVYLPVNGHEYQSEAFTLGITVRL